MNFDYPWMPSNVNKREFELLAHHSQLLNYKELGYVVSATEEPVLEKKQGEYAIDSVFKAGLLPPKLSLGIHETENSPNTLLGALTHTSTSSRFKNSASSIEVPFYELTLPELTITPKVPNLVQAHQLHSFSRHPELEPTDESIFTEFRNSNLNPKSELGHTPVSKSRSSFKKSKIEPPCDSDISDLLFDCTIVMLTGGETDFFSFDLAACQFKFQPLGEPGINSNSLKNVLQHFVVFGSHYKIIETIAVEYINNVELYGLTGRTFGIALKEYLGLVYSAVLLASEKTRAIKPYSFLHLKQQLQTLSQILSILLLLFRGFIQSQFLRTQDSIHFEFLPGVALPRKILILDVLDIYIKTIPHLSSNSSLYVLYTLFFRASNPYIEWLKRELFLSDSAMRHDAKIGQHEEFFDASQEVYPAVLFTKSLFKHFLRAKNSINLLKQHSPNHPLLKESPTEQCLELTYSRTKQQRLLANLQNHHENINNQVQMEPIETLQNTYTDIEMQEPTTLFDSELHTVENILGPLSRPPTHDNNPTWSFLRELHSDTSYLPNIQADKDDNLRKIIYSQCRFIISTAHKTIIQDRLILNHINFVNDYIFLNNGSFVQSIQSLLSEAFLGVKPSVIISKLNLALSVTLSKISKRSNFPPGGETITFTYNTESDNLDFFDCLSLSYVPVSPVNIFFTPEVFVKFNHMFHNLTRLLAIRGLLVRREKSSTRSRLSCLAYMQALNFVTSLQNTLSNAVVYPYLDTARHHLSQDPWSMDHPGVDYSIEILRPNFFLGELFLAPGTESVYKSVIETLDTITPLISGEPVKPESLNMFVRKYNTLVGSLRLQNELLSINPGSVVHPLSVFLLHLQALN